MRRRYLAVLVFALCFPAAARSAADDREALQGTWLPTAAELAGRKFPDEVRMGMKLVVKDDTYTVTVREAAGDAVDRGTVKLNPGSSPKGMDILGTEGPNKGRTILAIYQQEGDTLRICYDLAGKTRPTEFKTAAGTQLFLVTYKRDKP